MALSLVERELLAEELLFSVSGAERDAIDTAWLAEARRREAAFARGEMTTAPIDEVIARIRG